MSVDQVEKLGGGLEAGPRPKMPIVFCVDTTERAKGCSIDLQQKYIDGFYKHCQLTPDLSSGVEVAIVTCADEARLFSDFASPVRGTPPVLPVASGDTSISAGVELALKTFGSTLARYRLMGVEYYRPQLVIMAASESNEQNWEAVASETRQQELEGRLIVVPVAVSKDVDKARLAAFSKSLMPVEIENLTTEYHLTQDGLWGYALRSQFRCPQRWSDFELEVQENVRLCQVCNRKVHRCETLEQARELCSRGECVSIAAQSVDIHSDHIPSVDECEDSAVGESVRLNLDELVGWFEL